MVAGLLLVGAFVGTGGAATSSTVVSATIPSATTLVTTGCASGTAGVTEFGTVLPGSPARTTNDCAVTFGSSNDSSTLRLAQADGAGTAMQLAAKGTMTTGSSGILAAIGVATRQVAWVGGNAGELRITTDGGATWSTQNSTIGSNIRGIHAESPTRAWAVAYGGTIIRTTNGTSWATQPSGTGEDLYDIHAVDDTIMVAVGGDGNPTVVRSTDGGGTWGVVAVTATDDLHDVDFGATGRGWAVGESGTIVRSDDRGATWVAQNISACTSSDLRGVAAVSSTVAVVVSHLGRICRTTDAGATWTLISSGTTENLWAIDRAPDGALWAVGRGTASPVLRSIDDGLTWTQVTTEAVSLEDVVAFDRESAWWIGWGGLGVRFPSGSLPDYDDAGGIDWAGTSSMFAVCLSGAASATTVWPTSSGCPVADGTHWRAVPLNTGLATSRVATTATNVANAQANFRFGFRPATTQAPGRYVASVAFEVVAPST